MSRHPKEQELALYAGGDLAGWARARTAWHVRGCGECSAVVEAFHVDQMDLEETLAALPRNLDWGRMEAEMTANIRLGLAAGECVAPAMAPGRQNLMTGWNWRPAALVAALMLVFCAAWALNMPRIQWGHAPDRGAVASALPAIHQQSPRVEVPAPNETPRMNELVRWDGSTVNYGVDPAGVTLVYKQ